MPCALAHAWPKTRSSARDDRASRAAHGSAGASLAARGAIRRAMPRADASTRVATR